MSDRQVPRRQATARDDGRHISRRGRDLPLPLLLLLAIGAVAGERLGRRGLLLITPLVILALVLGGVGLRAAAQDRTSATPTPGGLVAAVPSPIEATTPPADPSIPPNAGGQPFPTATIVPLQPATAMPTASEIQPTAAVVPTAKLEPTVAPPTAVPVTPTPQPRGTTIIPILMYHYVRVVTDPQDTIGIGLSVKPALFAQQMQYLADNGYTTLTMNEVYDILAGRKTLPAKPIALTFDDGYRDFYTAAWPVLQQHGFKATSYVITDFIGWDAYMTWPMLQELSATGQIEIGAHTRSHVDLRALSAAKLWDEIIGSKTILETGLGRAVGAFCYPAGFYNAAVIAAVKRANFLTATTVSAGTKQNLQNQYELPRIRVNGPDPLTTWVNRLP